MEIGLVKKIDIDVEMRESYLSYAMSVIVSRALPDARDGLKPVQRRILYAMHDMGLAPDRSYKKSARVVGEVLGKYHPHGDQSVYDAMVRLAQDFSMRYPVVDGQGNFGSIDGDAAAAMRYTEARMTFVGSNMLDDIQKETVDFSSNFDDSLLEPVVLPAVIPNLLVNGSSGIAVGMSTSIPPHNLREVTDALTYLIENWERIDEITSADLLQFIQGPDFPTGGIVFRYRENSKADDGRSDALTNGYSTGKGRITVRAKVHLEEMERGKSRIVITELPYQTNKTNLISRIADLHRDGRVEGLTDLRDETDRNGIRIVLETTRNVEPEEILKTLYRLTPLQGTFSINMVALVNGEPRVLNLKQALRIYIEHRLEIIKRRSEYDLRKAEDRAHILEGLLAALDHLDEVIATIRRSRTVETARTNLIKQFKLTEIQTQAILEMPLRRLAALERRKIQDEYKEKKQLIKHLKGLLSSPQQMRSVILDELSDVVEAYADRRQTQIVDMLDSEVTIPRDLIPEEDTWVMLSEQGNVARSSSADIMKISGKQSEMPLALFKASMKDLIYFFTTEGEAVCLAAHQLPQTNEYGVGSVPIYELTPLPRNQMVVSAVVVPRSNSSAGVGYITMATLAGSVKRVRVEDVPGVSSESFTMIRIDDEDSLGWARLTAGDEQIILATAMGYVIRFQEETVRPMGLPAGGIGGVRLKGDTDGVVAMDIAREDSYLWSITDTGMAKATPLNEYPTQGRNGQGVVNFKLVDDAGNEVVTAIVGDLRTPLLVKMSTNSIKPMAVKKAKVGGRAAKPTPVAKSGPRSRVVGVITVYDASKDIVAEEDAPEAEQLALLA